MHKGAFCAGLGATGLGAYTGPVCGVLKVNVLSIAQSGMQSAQMRLNSAANNVANANTPGFRRDEVQAQSQPEGGVATRVQKADRPGVNLEQEVVEQMSASFAYKANLQVLRTADRTVGSLLNERA